MKIWAQSAANRPLAVESRGQRDRPGGQLFTSPAGVQRPFPFTFGASEGNRGCERAPGLGRRPNRGAWSRQPLPERAARGGHYFQRCQQRVSSSEGGGQGPCTATFTRAWGTQDPGARDRRSRGLSPPLSSRAGKGRPWRPHSLHAPAAGGAGPRPSLPHPSPSRARRGSRSDTARTLYSLPQSF